MTARDFLKQFEASRGVKLRRKGQRLVVRGTLTQQDKLLVGGHRAELLAALDGQDVTLHAVRKREEYRAAGLVQLDNGAWTHPDGDHVAEQILCGLISFAEARTHADQRRAPKPSRSVWHGQPNGKRPYSE